MPVVKVVEVWFYRKTSNYKRNRVLPITMPVVTEEWSESGFTVQTITIKEIKMLPF
jgi:hypothetical protein